MVYNTYNEMKTKKNSRGKKLQDYFKIYQNYLKINEFNSPTKLLWIINER